MDAVPASLRPWRRHTTLPGVLAAAVVVAVDRLARALGRELKGEASR
jgi:hypothetical protein